MSHEPSSGNAPGREHLLAVSEEPYNAETPLSALAEARTPTDRFFVRNHFPVPSFDAGFELAVTGEVDRPRRLGLDELRELPRRTVAATLECAGNGRSRMVPKPPGVIWGFGAAATAEFTGVPLAAVLERSVPRAAGAVVVLIGADSGEVESGPSETRRVEPFARALSAADARDPDVLLAWEMNGEPLTPDHGFPLRAVVPGRYAVDSVKWLVEIRLQQEPFRGFFQEDHYRIRGEAGTPEGAAVGRMRVRSVIARPAAGEERDAGTVEIAGGAWSGGGPIVAVDLSTDGGRSWHSAELGTPLSSYAATPWRFEWRPPGPGSYELVSRARDEAGAVQPTEPRWNTLGYGNNEAHRVRFVIR